MNLLSLEQKKQVVASLVEGNSIRATERMTGVTKKAIGKLLAKLGKACAEYQYDTLRNLPCKRVQCDEIWSFCYSKQKNVPAEFQGMFGYGDVWTWTALCADTKVVPCWLVGKRDAGSAYAFVQDLADRLANRIQLTTDGHRVYLEAVEAAFGGNIDYAMLVKMYGEEPKPDTKYSPSVCIGAQAVSITGRPKRQYISTSYVERQNLSMRMGMRRFTRLTNGFSKKVENLRHAVALYFMHYNFCRVHQTLRVTPAMEAGVSNHVWTLEEVIGLIPKQVCGPRGPYKKVA